MKRVFTVYKDPRQAGVLFIGVDPEQGSHAGDIYRAPNAHTIDINQEAAENAFITDEFGTFLRGYAPVRDSAGQVIGAVIVEAPADWVQAKMRPVMWSGLASLLVCVLIAIPSAFFLSRKVSRPLTDLRDAVQAIGEGRFETRLSVESKDEFGAVAQAVNTMAAGLEERSRVKAAFARYVSHQVVDSILKSKEEVRLSGDRRRITVLFCDIRGFSTFSEKMAPEDVVRLLNEYFERMVEIVFRNNGTLDKFIGDGLMVIFGAPEDDPLQEEHAIRTAIEMQQGLHEMTKTWEAQGIVIRIGVGINSGPAVVGNIGSSRRMDYTAIGDTVNLASRLESATKELGVGILISENTYVALRKGHNFREMGSVQVRGRSEPVLTYTIES
jgi:adenylate cyclase